MKDAMGWYVDPDDDSLERYWNGSMWQREQRPRQDGTPRSSLDTSAAIDYVAPDGGSTDSSEKLLLAILVEQRRSANYLAILTYITVILLILGVAGTVIAVLASK